MSGSLSIGLSRNPTLALGASVSLAAHAAVLATLPFLSAGTPPRASAPPPLEFARGAAVQVRVVSRAPRDAAAPRAAQPAAPAPAAARAGPGWTAATAALDPPAADPPLRALRPRARIGRPAPAAEIDPAPGATAAAPPPVVPPADLALPLPAAPPPPAPATAPVGLDHGAAIVDLRPPVYPLRSIRLGEEGTAVVEIQVRANGQVAAVRLRASSGYRRLDTAALEAARRGRYRPARRGGRAVEALLVVPFRFALEDTDRAPLPPVR